MIRRSRLSITVWLIAGIGGLVTLSLGTMLAVGLFAASSNTMGLMRQSASETMKALQAFTLQHLQPAAINAAAVADMVARNRLRLDDGLVDDIRHTLVSAPQLRGVGVFLASGEVVRIGRDGILLRGTPSDVELTADRIERAMRLDGVAWGPPTWSIDLEQTLVLAQAPIRIDGQSRGFVATTITTNELSDYLAQLTRDLGTAFILDEKNRVIAHPSLIDPERLLGREIPTAGSIEDEVLVDLVSGRSRAATLVDSPGDGVEARLVELTGGRFVVLTSRLDGLPGRDWSFGVAVPASLAEVFLDRLYRMGLAGVVLLALTLAALLWLAYAIRRPVTALAGASDRVRRLELEPRPALPSTRITELDDAATAFDRMVTALRSFESYVPRRLVFRIMAEGGDEGMAPSTREVTVLFTDIVGFTSASERMPAMEVASLLNRHFTLIADCVETEDGTIDKYIGDSVMAFWGAPSTQPDHAARAVRAVRAIAAAVGADNADRKPRGLPPLRIRIGLHSGPVLAGDIGAPGRVNYTIVGDTVNAANRIEALGKEVDPDAEVIALASADTLRTAALDPDSHTSVGARSLRGRAAPVTVHRII